MSPQPLHPSNPLRCPSAGPAMLELDASKELAQLGPLSTPPQTSQEWDKLTVSAAYSQQDNPGSQQIGVAIQPRPPVMGILSTGQQRPEPWHDLG